MSVALAAPAADHSGRCEDESGCTEPAEVGWLCPGHAIAQYLRETGPQRAGRASLRPSSGGSGRA